MICITSDNNRLVDKRHTLMYVDDDASSCTVCVNEWEKEMGVKAGKA